MVRLLLVLVPLLLAVVLAPGEALAHAAFVSADPAPGARLPTAPGLVAMHFTEPINPRLSRATVSAPDGQTFAGGVAGDDLQVPLASDVAGIYEVTWTTVSLVDGHTLHGTFHFGVRATPAGAAAEAATELAPQPADLLVAAGRALEDTALLAALGGLLLQYLARRGPSLVWVRVPLRGLVVVAFVAGLAVVAGEALMAAPAPSASAVTVYLASGTPGLARLVRIGAEGLALSATTFGPGIAALPLLVALGALASAGHAAAVQPAWLGISADTIHLLAAAVWAGGILALATVRPPGSWRGSEARRLLERFTAVALPAFVATVGFGAVRGTQELQDLGDLVSSAYGQVLALKVLAVLAMVPLSWLAWRRRSSRPHLEAGLAVGVVVAAALLAAFPLPPARAGEAEAASAPPTQTASALPETDDLSLGSNAGQVLVALTLRPGTPGPNDVLVYLLPPQGESAAAGLKADLAVDGQPLPLAACGATCRHGTTILQGSEHVEVRVGGADSGSAAFDLPSLPAPDGSALLQQVQDRMHRLATYQLDEVLGPADPPLHTTYAFHAPDRMRLALGTGAEAVFVGRTRYSRDSPAGRWQAEDLGEGVPVPSFIWDAHPPADTYRAVHVLGTATVDGTSTQLLAFFLDVGRTPLWFRLWVDADGLVHRAQMRAQGHFMDQQYADFDTPVTIESPAP